MKRTKTYTPELREEAVKLVLSQGLTLEDAAARIAIPKGTLANWVSAAKRGATPAAAPGSRTVPELEAENAKLRKELAEVRMERDIVKNRPTRLPVPLMNRNSRRVHLMPGGLWP
jgi:transposase